MSYRSIYLRPWWTMTTFSLPKGAPEARWTDPAMATKNWPTLPCDRERTKIALLRICKVFVSVKWPRQTDFTVNIKIFHTWWSLCKDENKESILKNMITALSHYNTSAKKPKGSSFSSAARSCFSTASSSLVLLDGDAMVLYCRRIAAISSGCHK